MQKKVYLAIRLIAGSILLFFGLNKFVGFIEIHPKTVEMGAVMMGLVQSVYIIKLAAVIEIIAGMSFIVNKYTALMAVVLMPVMLNAFLLHLFLDPAGIGGAALILALTLLIMIENKDRYRDILKA